MGNSFLLDEEIQMFSSTTRLIQGKFLNEEILGPELDAPTQIRLRKQSLLGKRIERFIGISL
jgi:hypothetical protein